MHDIHDDVTEFVDSYDDKLTIGSTDLDKGVSVYLNGYEDDNHTELAFTAEAAEKIARNILLRIGVEDKSDSRVLASTISFNEGVLRLATIHNKTVEFRYTKAGSSVIETRRFTPSSCLGEGEHFRFTGYDPDRDGTRAYRLDRIKGTVAVIA